MGSSVLAELVTLIRDHPYVSCSLLVFLTPPFWPILKFFSPLLISTALFLVALVTMGPQFEEPSEQDRSELQPASELDEPAPRVAEEVYRMKSSKGVGDWVSSWKESGLMWVEHKLRNENWRGASLNDENVSILQEAFAHRVEAKPRVMVKLMTRRIPAEEDEPHSGSWHGGRAFESSPTRDLPHDFFSPHPSLSRRLDSDASLFDNVEPPPIEHDMPPQITGPASVTAPLLKYIDDASDSDEYDHHHHDEDMHLEFGERSLDAESISQDELSLANGTYGQPPPFTVREEDLPSSGSSDEGRQFFADLHQGTSEIESLPPSEEQVHTRDIDLQAHDDSAPPHVAAPEILHEEPPVPAPVVAHEDSPPPPPPPPPAPEEPPHPEVTDELHDIPELEDVAPPETETREVPAAAEIEPREAPAAATENEPLEAPAAATENEPLEAPAAPEHEPSEAPAAVDESAGDAPAAPEHEPSEAPAAVDESAGDAPAIHEEPDAPEVSTDHAGEELRKDLEVPHAAPAPAPAPEPEPELEPEPAPAVVAEEPHHVVERSMSLPVAASLATAVSLEPAIAHEALAPVEPRALGNAISLPVRANPIHPLIIPAKTSEQGPLSPDTDLGYATTPDHDRRALAGRFFAPERYNSITSMSGDESEVAIPSKILSAKEKLSKLEALSNSMPSGEISGRRDVSILRATTEEQVTHVTDKLRAYKEDSPSKRFQPDAPQLQITPPSTKVFNGPPSKSALLSQTIGRPSLRQVSSRTFAEKYVSSSSDSSEEIELDSDVGDGSESDSDFESQPAKPPPKPPQGKKTDRAEPVKKK